MTLNQLRAFLLAAREGSFTAAAVELRSAQASVSELIRRMEDELGLPLFVRGGRRLVLTAAGQELVPYAERAVAAVDEGRDAVASTGRIERGVVTFGLMRNWRYYGLDRPVRDFHRAHPQVGMRMVGRSSTEVAAAVVSGELEAGIVVLPVDDTGLDVQPLVRDEILYATADGAVRGPMTVERMVESPFIIYDASYGWDAPTRRQLAERAQLVGLKLNPAIELEHVEEALGLVGQGLGGTVVPRTIARSDACPDTVHTVSLREPMYDTIAFVKRRAAVLSPAADELARLASAALVARIDEGSPLERAPRAGRARRGASSAGRGRSGARRS